MQGQISHSGSALDTSPISGTQYTSSAYPGIAYPVQYIAIGVGGASPRVWSCIRYAD